jgi:glycosyltransferase involved in cell wall biosynthesis
VPISVVIITYNEERNLPRTLEQLRWCDDVIVVDSYSQDRTLEIAHAFQCRVVQQRFEGYGLQKNHGIALAKHDWVLSIDADEVLSQELQHELQQLDLAHSDYQGYFDMGKEALTPNSGSSTKKPDNTIWIRCMKRLF